MSRTCAAGLLCLLLCTIAEAVEIVLPTANNAVLTGHDADFFQPTATAEVNSGAFGCVRRNGMRFHEGVDIRPLQRDKRGEATDLVRAVAAGTVAFINTRPGLSNYGRYLIIEHRWDSVEVHTLYAHLASIAPGLTVGQPVQRGQTVGVMGRSTNTREGIPVERAHLHFEVNFLLNDNFEIWNRRRQPAAPPFGNYNGQNFVGLDPAAFLRAYTANPTQNFAAYVAQQPVAFTILVPARPFPWLKRHPEQLQPREAGFAGAVAYEIGATGWGLPVAIWPRAATELADSQRAALQRGRPVVARVNAAELAKWPCRAMVAQIGKTWLLTPRGEEWAQLLTFVP